MTKTDALVEELRFLSEWLADAKGSLTPDYGEVAGNNFQMMTMCPDPERLARAINALPAALAALAPELVDGVMEVRRLLEEARAIIAGGPENGILPTVASIDLAISKALASLTRAPTSEPDEAEVERVAEWRTIDSAPKDGTVILTVCTYDNPPTYELNQWFEINEPEYVEVGDGLYRREERLFTEGWSNNGHRASHWMPLPPPPSAT